MKIRRSIGWCWLWRHDSDLRHHWQINPAVNQSSVCLGTVRDSLYREKEREAERERHTQTHTKTDMQTRTNWQTFSDSERQTRTHKRQINTNKDRPRLTSRNKHTDLHMIKKTDVRTDTKITRIDRCTNTYTRTPSDKYTQLRTKTQIQADIHTDAYTETRRAPLILRKFWTGLDRAATQEQMQT